MTLLDLVSFADGARWHAAHIRLGVLGKGTLPYGHPESWGWERTKLTLAYAMAGWIVTPRVVPFASCVRPS